MVAAVGCLTVLTGCMPANLAKDLHKEGKLWDVTILNVYDGVGYSVGNTVYRPPAGSRFILVHLRMKNKTGKERLLKLDQIMLATNEEVAYGPSIVDRGMLIGMISKERVKVAADEEITRKLFYSYPLDFTPEVIVIDGVGIIKLSGAAKTADYKNDTHAGMV